MVTTLGRGWRIAETAILLCGHGSRDARALAEFDRTAAALRRRLPAGDFAAGHLEFARPTLGEALETLACRGARQIVALPAMLSSARHVRTDLPRIVDGFRAAHPGVEVRLGRDLGVDPGGFLDAAVDRVAAAAPFAQQRAGGMLLVVGRGARDPAANAGAGLIASMLRQRLGFAQAGVAFAGIAEPGVEEALDLGAQAGIRFVAVFPYLLFGGILVQRIHEQCDAASARFPAMAVAKAGHIGAHPGLVGALGDRALECLSGSDRAEKRRSTPL
jgi:sirohydrochlorin cobaltochelatase